MCHMRRRIHVSCRLLRVLDIIPMDIKHSVCTQMHASSSSHTDACILLLIHSSST